MSSSDDQTNLKWNLPRPTDRDMEKEAITDRVGPFRNIQAQARAGNYYRRIRPEVFIQKDEGKVVDQFVRRCWICNADTPHSVRMFVPDRDHGPVRARLASVCDECGFVWEVVILSEKLQKSQAHQARSKEEIDEGIELGYHKPRRGYKLTGERKEQYLAYLQRREDFLRPHRERSYAKKLAERKAGEEYVARKKAEERAAIDKRKAERAEITARNRAIAQEKSDRYKERRIANWKRELKKAEDELERINAKRNPKTGS